MASNFEFLRAVKVAPAAVENLQLAVQHGEPLQQNYGNHSARLLWCTPSQVIYNCYIVFEKGSSDQWKWKGFVMPAK